MTRHLRDRLLRLMTGAVVTGPFLCGSAYAEPIIGADISGRVEYATNPFLIAANNTDAAKGVLSIAPYLEDATARSKLRLSGRLAYSEYVRRYRGTADYLGRVAYDNSLTSRLQLRTGAEFESNATGNYRPQDVAVDGIPTGLPDVTDITLVGLQERRNQFRGNVGVSYSPDNKNSITLDYTGAVVRFPNSPFLGVGSSEFSSIGQSFGYQRTINQRFSIGASVSVSRTNYFGTALGDSTVISPNLNANLRLSARWTLSGGIGITSLRQTSSFGPVKSQDLAANLSLCHAEARESFCFSGSRNVAPSSLGSSRQTTSLGASYRYKLSSRTDFSFSGNYVRSEQGGIGVFGNSEYLSGGGSMSRKLTGGLSLSVDAGFSRSKFLSNRADAHGSIGVFYRLGGRR